jgi:hypothetical protein
MDFVISKIGRISITKCIYLSFLLKGFILFKILNMTKVAKSKGPAEGAEQGC